MISRAILCRCTLLLFMRDLTGPRYIDMHICSDIFSSVHEAKWRMKGHLPNFTSISCSPMLHKISQVNQRTILKNDPNESRRSIATR